MSFLWKFLLWVPTPFIRGWVLARFWLWFVVPTFHVEPISSAAAYGIAGTAFMAVYMPNFSDYTGEWDAAKWFARMFTTGYAMPLISLGMGWMVQRWWL